LLFYENVSKTEEDDDVDNVDGLDGSFYGFNSVFWEDFSVWRNSFLVN
jgi:hypothetical protein